MTDPFTGLPTDAPGCSHAMTLEGHTCGRPPTVHMASHTDLWGLVTFETCFRHAAIARAAGDFIAEHPWEPLCATGDCWPSSVSQVGGDDPQPRSRARHAVDVVVVAVVLAITGVALVLLLGGINMVLGGPR